VNEHKGIVVAEAGRETTRARMARTSLLTLALLSVGHFFIDMYSSALGALQPFLVDKFELSLTKAGILGGLLVFSSSVMQPVYGYLSDRFHTRMFAALAPATAGLFISTLGLAPRFEWLLLMVCLGGAGIASFHPHASARATLGVEEHRGRSMAIFISAGTLGLAIGPSYFSTVTSRWGLSQTHWAALPGIMVTVLLLGFLPAAPVPAIETRLRFNWEPLRLVWKPLTILYFLVFIRSILQITFAQFLPLYLHLERGFAVTNANYTLSLYLVSGATGGFIGGHLADRFGGRLVILISMIVSIPFFLLFFFASGPLSILGLAAGGFILLFTIPVNVVMAQELVPSQAGTVSALMMGFAWGMAGLVFIPFTGWASDLFSLHHVMASLLVFPVIGFFLALKLPK
jgi:FSR family fosmidomycin resistance protein-like MFS transporter